MSPRTVFLSKLVGLYCMFVALSMITRRQATLESVNALLHDPSMMFVVGVITLAAGLALVLAHNVWSSGALAVVVTLVGWVTVIKGLFFCFCPQGWKRNCSCDSSTTKTFSICTDVFHSVSAAT
jgi:vacuolar-type H+-ATPase subunit I/STV1